MPDSPLPIPLSVTIAPLGDDIEATLARVGATPIRFVQWSATQPGARPRDLDNSARRSLREKLRRLELSIGGIDLWIPVEHLTQSEHMDRALTAVKGAIELAADFGRVPVSLSLPRSSLNADIRTGGADSMSVIDAIAGWCDHFGVEIADHARPLVLHDVLRIGIDPALWLSHNEDPIGLVANHVNHLSAARLCDLLRSGLRGPVGEAGESRLDFFSYAITLATVGYARPVVIDARQWNDPWSGLARTVQRWTEALGAIPQS